MSPETIQKDRMKKVLLLLLIASSSIYSMEDESGNDLDRPSMPVSILSSRHSNYDRDKNDDNDGPRPVRAKKRWTTTKKFIVALLAVNAIGLGTDIASMKTSHVLSDQVSPITAYPFQQGFGFPFSPTIGPERNPNCTYTEYAGAQWPTSDFPGAKGDCPCILQKCVCTVEECPPAQLYEKYWRATFATQITSITMRVASILGIGLGAWLYDASYGLE